MKNKILAVKKIVQLPPQILVFPLNLGLLFWIFISPLPLKIDAKSFSSPLKGEKRTPWILGL